MDVYLSHSLYLVTFTIFVMSIILFKFTQSYDDSLSNCSQPFNCGSVKNLKFPFWGDTRAPYCGLPQFHLHCHNNVPTMTMSSVEYRIIEADPPTHKITIARADYWDSLCPSNLANTSIDHSFFDLSSLSSYITLFYGCHVPLLPNLDILGHSTCENEGVTTEVVFGVGIFGLHFGCKGEVNIPIMKIPLPGISVLDLLHKGFELVWRGFDNECENCMESGGECGYNWTEKTFNCLCPDQPHASHCSAVTPGIFLVVLKLFRRVTKVVVIQAKKPL